MAFNFTAFTYIVALIGDAFLIFFAIFHVIAFDELKTDYKNPIDQCNSLNPVTTQQQTTECTSNSSNNTMILFSYSSFYRNIYCTYLLICYSCSAANGSRYASTYL